MRETKHNIHQMHIAKTQYRNSGVLPPKALMKLGLQMAVMLLATVGLLVQLDSTIDYSSLSAIRSSYTTYFPSYTDEPVVEESRDTTKPERGRNLQVRPLFGFIPYYVAVMSGMILLIVIGGIIVLYLYTNGYLR